jgi:hypothetical protein
MTPDEEEHHMRSDAETQIARRAAQRLAEDIDPTLPEQVEQELAKDPLEQRDEKPLEPISLGALIVSMAAFGWTIYRDLKKDREAAQQAATVQRLTDQLREEATANGWLAKFSPQRQASIIDGIAQAIVDEP